MNAKGLYLLAAGIGTTFGSFLPSLWHAGAFSAWGIIFSTIGGFGGLWLAYKVING